MENLSINEPPPQQDGQALGAATGPTQGAPQLPPQMFTTAAQLLDLTDKKLMLVLRDGRKLIGILRSWDQFANLVLADTKERYYVVVPALSTSASITHTGEEIEPQKLFCDIPRGTYLVRGENVLLLGEIDLDRDDEPPPGYQEGSVEEVFKIQKDAETSRKKADKIKVRKAGTFWGGELEGSGEVLF